MDVASTFDDEVLSCSEQACEHTVLIQDRLLAGRTYVAVGSNIHEDHLLHQPLFSICRLVTFHIP